MSGRGRSQVADVIRAQLESDMAVVVEYVKSLKYDPTTRNHSVRRPDHDLNYTMWHDCNMNMLRSRFRIVLDSLVALKNVYIEKHPELVPPPNRDDGYDE